MHKKYYFNETIDRIKSDVEYVPKGNTTICFLGYVSRKIKLRLGNMKVCCLFIDDLCQSNGDNRLDSRMFLDEPWLYEKYATDIIDLFVKEVIFNFYKKGEYTYFHFTDADSCEISIFTESAVELKNTPICEVIDITDLCNNASKFLLDNYIRLEESELKDVMMYSLKKLDIFTRPYYDELEKFKYLANIIENNIRFDLERYQKAIYLIEVYFFNKINIDKISFSKYKSIINNENVKFTIDCNNDNKWNLYLFTYKD